MKIDLSHYVNRHGGKVKRLIWEIVWRLFAATTPRWTLQNWRNFLLRRFGAKVGKGVRVHGGARIWSPWSLEIGENSWIAEGANIYCVDSIRIGHDAVVSEGAFVCTAEHDVTSPKFELVTRPITIGDMAWVGSHAIILPGRNVGEGAVVAAGSVVTRDVAPWTVVAGNPARVIRTREVRPPESLLTFVIPVKNEEINLPGCLECLKDQPHVVVVDSCSTDRTLAIAAEYGREVVDFKWNGRYPKKRNWLLEHYAFKTPWVMFIDADERVTEDWVSEVNRMLKNCSDCSDCSIVRSASVAADSKRQHSTSGPLEQSNNSQPNNSQPNNLSRLDAFVCYYDNFFLGRLLKHGDVMHKTAILRLGAGSYEQVRDEQAWSKLDMEIHEQLVVEGRIGEIKARLQHYDRRSLAKYLVKHEEYAKWEANRYHALTDEQRRLLTPRQTMKYRYVPKWWFGLAYFCVSYFLKLGFLDGLPGFWFAWLKMKYFRNVRRKILAKGNKPA